MLEDIVLDSIEPVKIPNLQDFRYLLKHSRLFQDYFNVFLNLPVFSQKFYYDESRNMFSAACTLTGVDHQVTHPKALVWVHKYRLPLFWKSELLFEYLFTTALAMKSPGSLVSIHDYKDFRAFLLMTQGESLVHFWLDAERLKYLKDPLAQDYLISKIHRIYTDITSPCLLPNSVCDIIVTGLSHCKVDGGRAPESKFNFDGSFIRNAAMRVFAKAQESSLEILCHYWLAKHCVHAKKAPIDKSTALYLGKHRTSSVFSQKIARKDNSLDAVTHDYCSFPHINLKGEEKRAGKLPTLSFRTSQKPSFHGYNMFSTTSELSRYNSCLTKLLKPLIAPGTQNLLDASRQIRQPKSLTGPKVAGGIKEYNIISSGLKADSISGNPFMRYLLSKSGKTSVVNYLLFLQSIEEILKEDKIMRRSVLSGRDTCYPYHCYHYQPMVTDIEEFIHLFVKPNAYKGVHLPLTLQKKMIDFLPRGLGKSLLNTAQMFAIKKLLPSWKEFLLDDCNVFISQCVGGPNRVQRPSKHNIIGVLLSDTQVCSVMWRSFRLAESVLTPECISDYQVGEPLPTSVESSTLLTEEEEDGADMEMVPTQPTSAMITTWSMCTQCSNTDRRTYITSVTLPAIQKRKKVEPPIPKTFSEVLYDSYQLENFEKFLLAQDDNGAAPLEFWMAIEEFKGVMSDLRMRDKEAVSIQKKFFGPDADKNLQCQDPIIYELMQEDDVNPYQLISAQLQVVKSMEENWFQKYLRSIRRGGFFKLENAKQPLSSAFRHKNHVKSLWQTFLRNVCHFIRDVNNQDTLVLFRKYLAKEILNSGNQKKVFGKRLVYLNKLLDDLGFWIEAQKFKDVADSASENKKGGAYSQEVDNILHRKAHAITNCYLNSPVPPKIQINCAPDVVQYILDRIGNEQYTRELFHEATIFVFPALFHYWKLFAKSSVGGASPTNKQPFAQQENQNRRAFIRRSSLSDDATDVSDDSNDLVLSFSLSGGIFWRRGRQIIRYENLKDYLTFRVSYLY